jgi:hypothetical protein
MRIGTESCTEGSSAGSPTQCDLVGESIGIVRLEMAIPLHMRSVIICMHLQESIASLGHSSAFLC